MGRRRRIRRRHLLDQLSQPGTRDRSSGRRAQAGGDPPPAILRLHGPSLGLAIGVIGAIGLVATTTWLVLRGTAAQSTHAGLLAEILPGYTVSVAGSVVGAVELFLILYLVCMGFAFVYNRIVAVGHRRR